MNELFGGTFQFVLQQISDVVNKKSRMKINWNVTNVISENLITLKRFHFLD